MCAAWCAAVTYLSATALGTFLEIAAQGLLGLTRVCPCYRWCSSRSSASIKCLRQSHRFPRYVLDSQKVVLGLLSCLEHCLECLPLMSGIKRLDNAVLWKISAVVGLKTRIEAIPKMGAQAHWVVSLTREGASCTHELLEVGLYRADNLISIAVRMHLDMINGGMRLHGVAGAQLEKHGVPHRSQREPYDPALDIRAHLGGVSSGRREIELGWLKIDRKVLEGDVENLSLDICR